MNKLVYSQDKNFQYMIVILTYLFYMTESVTLFERVGLGMAPLAIIPVVVAGWYFGVIGGILVAIVSILTNVLLPPIFGHSFREFIHTPGTIEGSFALIVLALIIGGLSRVIRERKEAITKLETYERERQSYTDFLELLTEITGIALEADNLDTTLQIFVERIAKLFKADDCFFALWDSAKATPIPMTAHGSMRETYPHLQFEAGEQTPGTFAMEVGHPVAIEDLANSSYIDRKIAALFPSRSMLALPLITQSRKLGVLLLGFNQNHFFDKGELLHSRLTAEHIALVLSKSLILEEERKRVKQLTALHDIALLSIDVDTEDELIQRVTDIIGRNLFPDNFGILLLDEESGILHAHRSYHFFVPEVERTRQVHLGEGVTGQVVATGNAQRIGNVRRVRGYLEVDDRTVSELCVPIKFKEHILGVINAESTKRDAFTEDDERLLITLAGQIATAMEQLRKAHAERKWLDQIAHSRDMIYALAQITTHIEKAFSSDDIIKNLGMELSNINLSCVMGAYDQERSLFTVNYALLEPRLRETVEISLGYPLLKHTFPRGKLNVEDVLHPAVCSNAADEIQILFARADRQDFTAILQAIGVGPATEPLRLPMVFEEDLLGILWIWGKNLTRADLPIMSIFAKQVGISLERARLFQEVQSLALTDPLTELHNRRSLFELGRVEFSRAHRMNREFSCMMLDLDYFKEINDTYGHPVGDQVLKEFAKRCKSSIREIDLIGRYGGEELIILLPETNRELAVQVAERLRSSIAATPIKVQDQQIALTVSIGVATKDEHTLDLETLIARADQAMYIAKHKGRNRVAISK